MRKQIGGRRVLSFLLSLVLTLSLLPVGVFAADNVASINGKNYTSIKDAWNAVKNGGTIELLADWNLEKTIKNCLNVEKNVTVTLNGHIIDRGLAKTSYYGYGEGQVFYVKDGASLTVNGGEKTSHEGYRDGHLWFPGTKSGKTAMSRTGGILTGGACDDSDAAGAITMRKNTLVILKRDRRWQLRRLLWRTLRSRRCDPDARFRQYAEPEQLEDHVQSRRGQRRHLLQRPENGHFDEE